MSSFRDKIQIFFLGLMLGLLIGGGFFILKLDNYFKELSIYKSAPEEDDENAFPVKKDNDRDLTKQPVKKKQDENIVTSEGDETPVDSTATQTNDEELTAADSLSADSSLAATNVPQGDEIVVRKDEMLSARTVELINLNLTANAGKKDSLQTGNEPKASYRVEYWKSPINYKGYKMTRNKLVLYGISSADAVSLFRLDDDIYLKHLSATYRLGMTNDFRQFEKVSDPSVLSKIK
jgi:hypothetical protein